MLKYNRTIRIIKHTNYRKLSHTLKQNDAEMYHWCADFGF